MFTSIVDFSFLLSIVRPLLGPEYLSWSPDHFSSQMQGRKHNICIPLLVPTHFPGNEWFLLHRRSSSLLPEYRNEAWLVFEIRARVLFGIIAVFSRKLGAGSCLKDAHALVGRNLWLRWNIKYWFDALHHVWRVVFSFLHTAFFYFSQKSLMLCLPLLVKADIDPAIAPKYMSKEGTSKASGRQEDIVHSKQYNVLCGLTISIMWWAIHKFHSSRTVTRLP